MKRVWISSLVDATSWKTSRKLRTETDWYASQRFFSTALLPSGGGDGGGRSDITFAPITSTTSTEWCATRARPDSEMMSGWGTWLPSQISCTIHVTSLAYSWSE